VALLAAVHGLGQLSGARLAATTTRDLLALSVEAWRIGPVREVPFADLAVDRARYRRARDEASSSRRRRATPARSSKRPLQHALDLVPATATAGNLLLFCVQTFAIVAPFLRHYTVDGAQAAVGVEARLGEHGALIAGPLFPHLMQALAARLAAICVLRYDFAPAIPETSANASTMSAVRRIAIARTPSPRTPTRKQAVDRATVCVARLRLFRVGAVAMIAASDCAFAVANTAIAGKSTRTPALPGVHDARVSAWHLVALLSLGRGTV